jgi:hypothetical protein
MTPDLQEFVARSVEAKKVAEASTRIKPNRKT